MVGRASGASTRQGTPPKTASFDSSGTPVQKLNQGVQRRESEREREREEDRDRERGERKRESEGDHASVMAFYRERRCWRKPHFSFRVRSDPCSVLGRRGLRVSRRSGVGSDEPWRREPLRCCFYNTICCPFVLCCWAGSIYCPALSLSDGCGQKAIGPSSTLVCGWR